MKRILDLCGGTGSWSLPYARAGYDVLIIDPLRNETVESYLNKLRYMIKIEGYRDLPCHGILAAPPCTEFSSAGAKHWDSKDPALLDAAIGTVRACYEVIQIFKPDWWAMENPVGRLAECCPFLGGWKHTFDPWEYGDPWTKKTCLWGEFVMPPKTYTDKRMVPNMSHERVHRMPGVKGRAMLRSMTPPRFAEAFFRSNP